MRWLDTCNDTHAECKPARGHVHPPTRLIDVNPTPGGLRPFLFEHTAGSVGQYAALGYYKTTRKTGKERRLKWGPDMQAWDSLRSDSRFLKPMAFHWHSQPIDMSRTQELSSLWMEFVTDYTRRKLAKGSDKLPAISGIAKGLQKGAALVMGVHGSAGFVAWPFGLRDKASGPPAPLSSKTLPSYQRVKNKAGPKRNYSPSGLRRHFCALRT
ncbi:hypothetical protein QBC44DRAFT_302865 [Cladorrhinum sp. PSN332]|nr:hypothetical protein QBC44DRAFT_302865 [Cladorrhinum sp. PSN332]